MAKSTDSFLTIKDKAKIEIKIKGSKFIGQAVPCADEAGAEEILDGIRRKFHNASHHCFAYRIGLGGAGKFRYSDAGEPSGTAGRPIFDQIEGKDLTNLIIIVTRYFGGTKLGTGGLTHAYSAAAAEAIEKAGVIEKFTTINISMTVRFSDYNNVERLIRKYDANAVQQDFAEAVKLTVEIRESMAAKLREELVELTSGRIVFAENS